MSFLVELRRRNVFRIAVFYGVTTWLVLQVFDVVGEILVLPEWVGKGILLLFAVGFIPALLFSWIYELTPEGVKREKDIVRDDSITHLTAKKLDVAVIVLLIPALGLLMYDRFGPDDSPARSSEIEAATTGPDAAASTSTAAEPVVEDRSIAVLPFLNLSSDPEQEYFSDGLAESLLHMLAQINELHVAARTSSFRFKNHTGDVSDIGQQLKVAHVLEGSVRRAGNTVRVTAQLIKVDDGFHLWSGTYDRQMDDIFGIQDEIATQVVEALKVALLGDVATTISTRDTESLEAYESYLKGRQQMAVSGHGSLPEAESYFRRALEIDPGYQLALISLGQTHMQMANTGYIPFALAAEQLQPTAQRLLELDSESVAAQTMLAWATWLGTSGQVEEAGRMFQRAYEKNSEDGFVALYYATYLDWTGDPDRAVVVAGQALERDPMSGELHMRLGYAYLRLVEYEKALFHARRLVALEPSNPNGTGIESAIHQRAGRYAEAIRAIRISQELDPTDYELPVDEALNLLALGELDEAEARIRKARKMSPDGFLPLVAEATLHYRRGDLDRAVRTLQLVFDQGIENRRWGGFLTTRIIRDHALTSKRLDIILEQYGPWAQVDLLDSQVKTGRDYFLKTPMVPALRAAGRGELADAIMESARTFRDDDDDPGLTLAIASGDVDTLVAALTSDMAEGLRPVAWIQLESPAMAFARDDPRFKNLVSQYQAQIDNQKIAYALYQEESD